MKQIVINVPTVPHIALEAAMLADRDLWFGYETSGGLRAVLMYRKGTWGFVYDDEDYHSRTFNMKFEATTKREAIDKAIKAARAVLVFEDPSEFARWYTHSIPTRYGPEYILRLMDEHGIEIRDLMMT